MPICNPANQLPSRPNKHWQWGNMYFNWCFKHCFFWKECNVFSSDVNTAGNSRRVEEFVAALSSLDIPFKQQGLVITTTRIDTCMYMNMSTKSAIHCIVDFEDLWKGHQLKQFPWGSNLFTWKSFEGHLQAFSWGQDRSWHPWPGRPGSRGSGRAACSPASTSTSVLSRTSGVNSSTSLDFWLIELKANDDNEHREVQSLLLLETGQGILDPLPGDVFAWRWHPPESEVGNGRRSEKSS